MLQFTKAQKSASKLRLAIFGPSGAGKTYSALRIATGMGGRIAVIDTERGSASLYADAFTFDVLELPAHDIATYCAGIQAASAYNVLIIDSLSHGWQELLQQVDKLARAKYRGNTWSAWSEGTPLQRHLVDALLGFPGHIIATMRSKTEWTTDKDDRGKSTPTRVGLAPEQGKGIEYEFTLLMELSPDHVANVIKDRTGRFQDRLITKPDEAFGRELMQWLDSGAAVDEPAPAPETGAQPERETPTDTRPLSEIPRPWPPEVTVRALRARAAKGGMSPASVQQAGSVARNIEALFGDATPESRKLKRYGLLRYAFDVDSAKALTSGQASALIAWSTTGEPDWLPQENAIAEAEAIVRAHDEASGQMTLDVDGEEDAAI